MSRNLKPLGVAVCLLALGAAGYAYLNPAFASACKNLCGTGVTWVGRQTESARASFKQSKFYASYLRALDDHQALALQRKKKAEAPKTTVRKDPPLDMSPEAVLRRERANWSVGQKIANGSAFSQYGKQLGFKTADQMASHIDSVVGLASPSATKAISGGRTAYWDERTRAVIIVNANASGGTMFKPQDGYPYFKYLK